MAIILINTIPAVSFAKNPIAVKLQTDAFISSAGEKARQTDHLKPFSLTTQRISDILSFASIPYM